MTTAVEDSDRAQPMTSPDDQDWPKPTTAIRPITKAHRTICGPPRPSTSARMRFRRSNDSSSPIMNSRKTTPSSPSVATCSGRSIRSGASQGNRPASAPTPQGPMATPASRNPMTGEILIRRNSGTMTPAVVRNSMAPLNSEIGSVEAKAVPVVVRVSRIVARAPAAGNFGQRFPIP